MQNAANNDNGAKKDKQLRMKVIGGKSGGKDKANSRLQKKYF